MLSLRKLFEVTQFAPRPVGPMAGVNEYVQNRIAQLKQAVASGRLSQMAFNQQKNEILKNRFNKQMGVIQFM